MSKYVRVEDANYTWEFPAKLIAENYAKYYSEGCGEDFALLVSDLLSSEYDIFDWFYNNMDWGDVEDQATIVETRQPDKYPSEFASYTVVEREDG